jgi:transposase InsO family protein
MAYSKNPYLPRIRMSAVILVRRGWSVRQTARYIGVAPGTISKWLKKASKIDTGHRGIPTLSSRPNSSPNRISFNIEQAIIKERKRTHRCGQVVHHVLTNKYGLSVSLATVHRVLDRHGLTRKYSPWKRRHLTPERPQIAQPGDLLELDTIHFLLNPFRRRFYVYSMIDVASRYAWAWAVERATVWHSLYFVNKSQSISLFQFKALQTDHGSEFSQHFTERVNILHRHSRVRKPNDQGYVERFNRTLKEECLYGLIKNTKYYNQGLQEYLKYYNKQRPHMGINYLTPMEKIHQLFPRS